MLRQSTNQEIVHQHFRPMQFLYMFVPNVIVMIWSLGVARKHIIKVLAQVKVVTNFLSGDSWPEKIELPQPVEC